MLKKIILSVLFLSFSLADAQTAWPSESWTSAVNLTSVMDSNGVAELSGLHWNPETNRLYLIQNDGRLRVLQLNNTTNIFTQIASKVVSGGPEGITQVDFSTNEFYTIDENNYSINKFTHSATFTNLSLNHSWNLLESPSPMQDTGNTGPEGIVFVPDSALLSAGFVSTVTGTIYTSTKGMGGLMFVASQNGGYVWVYDLNPFQDDDFAFVGKYKTNRTESCDLSFDRTTGLLYILHNVGTNFLEVTNLSTTIVSGENKFTVAKEYFIPNPTGSTNIEGFAITPKCDDSDNVSAWLCRDVSSNDSNSQLQDVLRWFNPFASEGNCSPLNTAQFSDLQIKIYPNPAKSTVTISSKANFENASLRVTNALGQTVISSDKNIGSEISLDVSSLQNGVYMLEVQNGKSFSRVKWIKE